MKQNKKWNIGCSGFYYKEWKEVFYPKGLSTSQWFNFYSHEFNTLEINMTFYRTPKSATLLNWYNTAPPDFRFTAKAPRTITHYKKFQHCEKELADFYALMTDYLQEKLACILFQFPPGFLYTEERLTAIVSQLDNRYVNILEFRHASWWNEEVYQRLQEKQITFCNQSHPALPAKIIKTAPVFYYRFHGVPQLYWSVYSNQFLDDVIKEIQPDKNINSAWLYFNNTAAIGAIENARYLQGFLRE